MKSDGGGASRGIAITTLGNGFAPLAGILSAPILAHALGVSGRGEVAAGTAPLILAMSGLTLGLPEAITYFVARGTGNPRTILLRGISYLTVVGLLGTVAIVAFASLLAGNQPAIVTRLISVAACFLVPSLILGAVRGVAAGRQAWGLIAIERLIGSGGRLAAIVLLVLTANLNPLTATICIAGSTCIGLIAYIPLPRARKPLQAPSPQQLRETAQLLSFGSRMWLGSLAGILLLRLDQTLMIPLSSTFELGLYAVAVSISEVALILNSAVRDVMFSAESASPQDARLGLASRLSTALTLSSAIIVALASAWGIPLFFGDEFSGALLPTVLLLFAIVAGNPGSVAGVGLSARGRPGLRSTSLVIAVVFNVTAVILLVPVLGAVGAALATLIGNSIAGFLNIIWLRIYFSIPMRNSLGIRKVDVAEFSRLIERFQKAR